MGIDPPGIFGEIITDHGKGLPPLIIILHQNTHCRYNNNGDLHDDEQPDQRDGPEFVLLIILFHPKPRPPV